MDEAKLKAALRDLTLGGLRFFESIGSTNDQALAWATSGARDFSLVVADEQTSGRGRLGRSWLTPAGSALAFSLILRASRPEREKIGRFSGLGALALVKVLEKRDITAQIKWPNDVLIAGKKIAGILVEAVWTGEDIDSLVIGIGVNVTPASIPPHDDLNFPATCLEIEARQTLDRVELLKDILAELIQLRSGIGSDAFLNSWQDALAFRGQIVRIWRDGDEPQSVHLHGLDTDGSLLVSAENGQLRSIHFGEVHLRPM